ncbi:MAG: CHASE3 domain-containing protein [Alcanivorax sp.]|nr:CHASE3 domain-containing protein [Alcanivorax sp.]
MRWPPWGGNLGQRSLLLTLVPLVLAAATAGILLYVLSLTRQADDEVQRGLRALGQIHAVHAALAEAASGVRGFIITHDETFLRPYERAEQQLREALQHLERDIDDPVQREQLADISRLVEVKLSNLAILAALSRELSGGQMLAYSRDNKELLDRLRRRIALMEERENQIITQQRQQQQRTRQIGHIATLAALLATFVLASLLSRNFATSLIRRIRHLRDNARRISRRDPLQVYPGQPADELAELDMLLVQTGNTLYEKLDELEAARHTAEQASQSKTRFLSRTSHELRTPLNAVIGFSTLLQKDIEQPAQRRQIEAIQHSAEHLLALVNDLLDMSRIEAGQLTLSDEVVDLSQQINHALEIVQGRAAARDIRLFREGCDDLAPVQGDAGRVLQVLINVLDNAVKFSPAGSSVVLRAEPPDAAHVRLHVIDEGPGIPAHFRAELFRPFSRQDAQQEGVGLGLAISYGLMQAMGGELTFQPAPHGSSCFTLCLRRSSVASKITSGTREAAPPKIKQPTMSAVAWQMVIRTDDDMFAMLMETTAQRLGIRCHRINGQTPLSAAITSRPWLLVEDAHDSVHSLPSPDAPPVCVLRRGTGESTDLGWLPVRTLPGDAPASAWRNALQEIIDEYATSGHA